MLLQLWIGFLKASAFAAAYIFPSSARSLRRCFQEKGTCPLPLSHSSITSGWTAIFSSMEDTDAATINGEQYPADTSANGGGLVTTADSRSQLFSAFSALTAEDQYDAVLTGLCAKILDDTTIVERAAIERLKDPTNLLNEMNSRRIQASPRSMMALIDSTVKAQDAQTMAQMLSLSVRNGSVTRYGVRQADILPLPLAATSRVKCPDGSMKTRSERLSTVADIPFDERGTEVKNAFGVTAVAGGCFFTDVAGMDDIAPFANVFLSTLIVVGALDNFYDLFKTSTSMIAKQVAKNGAADFELPEKDALPFGLGSGQLTGSVVRGFARLLTTDAERESLCEASALLTAYCTGLPCFAYRPNALEASVLVVESTKNSNGMDSLLSSAGIMRVLVWLLAPVAAESAKFPVCIVSNPREAESFLDRLEEFAAKDPSLADEIFWTGNQQERKDLLKWAYTEADLLLRENRKILQEVTERLTGGAATVGDCIAVLEEW